MPPDWLEALGIRNVETGSAAAHTAREKILEPARRVLVSSDEFTVIQVVFQGFVARAQCLHEAAVQMIDAENPHASFALLRAQAENAAGVLYAKDHPTQMTHFTDIDGHGVTVGKITNYAASARVRTGKGQPPGDLRFGAFKGLYSQLSKYTHPQAMGLLASSSVTDDDRTVRWMSGPHFKSPSDQLTAYGWAVELAEATHHLLYEFAQEYRLGYFGHA